ncbi:DUF1853 family protein [Microbulbifer sp. TYP-18]|uniref:DUF1853 family protein n=1 Tax=Microbulbifer sp. TYP-18 TaxID=3230024 RepID=UPI0034C66E80
MPVSPDLPQAVPDHWSNLLWSMGSPHIVRDCGLPLLEDSRRRALWHYFNAPETRLRLRPELERFLADSPSRRLGIYFEHLWAFTFSHHPDYALLYRNLPLRVGGQTLGELDFVVQYLPDNAVEHWEVAVKFYLQVSTEHWLGPGLQDRLDAKLKRMREHQLPVARHSAADRFFSRHQLAIDRQWALLPGRLFRPLNRGAGAPASFINPDCADFWWCDEEAFSAWSLQRDCRWLQLPRSCWLAPLTGADYESAEQTPLLTPTTPICLAGITPSGEQTRGFLVPDDWARRALSACADPAGST